MRIKLILGTILFLSVQLTVADDNNSPYDDEEHKCLSVAIYKESRGESVDGKLAVGHVILNRVKAAGFPDTVCGVVKQRTKRLCQFSWVCQSDFNRIFVANNSVIELARELLEDKHQDNTLGSLFFNNTHHQSWNNLVRTRVIGGHIFYKKRGERYARIR